MITKPIITPYIVLPVLALLFGFYTFLVVKRKIKIFNKALLIARLFFIMLLAFLIDLRIMDKKYNAQVEMKNLDVLFVVDTTISMWAEDYGKKNTRMDGVMADAEYIIDELQGSNFGLIRFDNNAQILCPFTQDHTCVRDAFSTIKTPDKDYAKGSSLNTSYDAMMELLDSSNNKKERMTIVFFMSDGEITNGSDRMSFEEMQGMIDAGAVMGYGTETGGNMQVSKNNFSSSKEYIVDPNTGKAAVSKIDESQLEGLAKDLDLEYIHMTDTSKIKYLVESIKNGSSLVTEKSDTISYEDTYFVYAIPLIILLLIELALLIRKRKL